jgi:hypothetical protein
MERAPHAHRGRRQPAATLQNNLAIARYPLQDLPVRSPTSSGIGFCEQRGLATLTETMEADCPGLLVDRPPEEALERAGAPLPRSRRGATCAIWLRALELAAHPLAARRTARPASPTGSSRLRTQATTDATVEVLAAVAAAQLAAAEPDEARSSPRSSRRPVRVTSPATPDNLERCCEPRWLQATPTSPGGSRTGSNHAIQP